MAFVLLLVAAVLAAIDQVIKYFVVLHVKPVMYIEVIRNLLYLSYVENRGAAFGSMENMRWLFMPLTIIGCAIMIVLLFKYQNHTKLTYASLTLLIAGGVGNLIDRIRLGYVVDYINISFFGYVFNFADCCVVIGSILLVIAVLWSSKNEDKTKESETTKKLEDEV